MAAALSGDVDSHGDIVDELTRLTRIERAVGPCVGVDRDEHVGGVAAMAGARRWQR